MKKIGVTVVLFSAFATAQQAGLPLHFDVSSDNFYSSGRWIPSDPKQKAPYPSETIIECDRQSRWCVEATAELYSGHPHVSTDSLVISKWDGSGITAISENGICMTVTMHISFLDKKISAIHSMKKLDKAKVEACKFLGTSGTVYASFIVKNSPRWDSDPYGESLTGKY